jgi:hypothetical protein
LVDRPASEQATLNPHPREREEERRDKRPERKRAFQLQAAEHVRAFQPQTAIQFVLLTETV